jgi:hypothetical protein
LKKISSNCTGSAKACRLSTATTASENDEERIPTTAGREGLRALLQCDNDEDGTTPGHDGLGTTPENDKENPSTVGRAGLRALLQCNTSGDRASSAHTTPSTSNARASTEETASAGHRRGQSPRCQVPQLAGRPYSLRAPLIDDDWRQCLSRNLLLNWVPQLGGVSDFDVNN